MKILKQLNDKEIYDIKKLCTLCQIERIPNFDPSIYIDPNIKSFYLEYEDKKLIGFLSLFYVDTKNIEIVAFIHPEFRNKGYFTKLFNEAKSVIPSNLDILYQIPANLVDKKSLNRKGYIFHHGEEELINRVLNNTSNVLNKLKIEDIPATAKIISESFESTIEEEIEFLNSLNEQSNTTSLVLKENNKVVGFIAVSNTADLKTSHVFAFCVDKDYRSKGFGKKMLNNLPQNPEGYVLRVEYSNIRAKKLYTETGFKVLSRTDFYVKSKVM